MVHFKEIYLFKIKMHLTSDPDPYSEYRPGSRNFNYYGSGRIHIRNSGIFTTEFLLLYLGTPNYQEEKSNYLGSRSGREDCSLRKNAHLEGQEFSKFFYIRDLTCSLMLMPDSVSLEVVVVINLIVQGS
jgi:hypothetical protein